jgi:mannose-6-phosphate isomerase-like protein (cupin superfamily)
MTSHIVDTGHWFVRAFTASLQAGNAGEDGVDEVLARLGEQDISAQAATVPQVRRLPACRFLPDAVAACLLSVPDLAAAIAALEDDLHWKQNPNYSDEAMGQPGYMNNYAYAEIIGPEGIWPGDDFLLTLLLLGPGLHYLRHSHPAPELYWILSGESQWQLRDEAFDAREPGETIWHEPFAPHATKVGVRRCWQPPCGPATWAMPRCWCKRITGLECCGSAGDCLIDLSQVGFAQGKRRVHLAR